MSGAAWRVREEELKAEWLAFFGDLSQYKHPQPQEEEAMDSASPRPGRGQDLQKKRRQRNLMFLRRKRAEAARDHDAADRCARPAYVHGGGGGCDVLHMLLVFTCHTLPAPTPTSPKLMHLGQTVW